MAYRNTENSMMDKQETSNNYADPVVDDYRHVLDGMKALKPAVKDDRPGDVKPVKVVSKKPRVVRRFTDAEKLRAIAVAKKKSVGTASDALGISERNIKKWLRLSEEQLTKMKLKASGAANTHATKARRRPLRPVQSAVVQKKVLHAVKNAITKKPTVQNKVAVPEPLTNEQIVERQQKIILGIHVIHKQLSDHSRRANIPLPPMIPAEFTQGAGKTDPASSTATTEYYTAFQTWMDQHIKKP